jgi:hypothetical protein
MLILVAGREDPSPPTSRPRRIRIEDSYLGMWSRNPSNTTRCTHLLHMQAGDADIKYGLLPFPYNRVF